MFISKKHIEYALKILPFSKVLGTIHIQTFFFAQLLNIKTWQRYIDIILLEIFCPSRANIHINKCYFAKSYSAKCYNEKIRNILEV